MNKLIELRNCDYKSYPLTTYEQIINFRTSSEEQSIINAYCVGIESRYTLPGPRTLLCHDYKGGYLDDASVKGSHSDDLFRFHHWHLIDTFIYFAHQLATIPPIPWIRLAHLNGVEILGTFIIESESDRLLLESILSDEVNMTKLGKSLAYIMNTFKFDGWLLNIETEVLLGPMLLKLVKCINEECKKLNKNSKVIWYDAVTIDGKLSWQNELNERNETFFDHCDGIFLNYNWRTKHLVNSLEVAKRKSRVYDVYVGVDVFGRGCFGGGGFNTNLATDFIRKFQLSIALFAPGWIHEANDSKKFNENNLRFWNSLNLPVRHLPNKLPIETSFCQGVGNKFFEYGQCVQCYNWTNHLMQQPLFGCDHGEIDYADSFIGGSCLSFSAFNRPVIKLRCEWNRNIQIMLIYKYSTNDETFDDTKLMVLGHSKNHVIVGRRMEVSSFKPSNRLMFDFNKRNIGDGWKSFFTCLTVPHLPDQHSISDEYLEKIYLHVDLKEDRKIDLKLGYLGVF